MKAKFLLFLTATFFFQSCSSYRDFDLKTHDIKDGHTYRITKNSVFTKIKVVSVADSILTYRIRKYEQQIHLRDIKFIKYKKLSAVKTIGLVLVTATAIFALSWSRADTNTSKDWKLNLPPQ